MSSIAAVLARQSDEIAELTARFGQRVVVGDLGVLDRAGHLALGSPGILSPNKACQLVRAADGWIAVNLAREEDQELVPAWLGCAVRIDPGPTLARQVRRQSREELIASATRLGLPIGAVGEITADGSETPLVSMGGGGGWQGGRIKVVDLSALWAGPLCGAVLADMGARVLRIESRTRPDPSRLFTPEFYRRLNHAKHCFSLDFATPEGRAELKAAIAETDILITSARPRAFDGLGLSPDRIFETNPGLIWIAVTGYGWMGPAADRVAFGDDAAAAGGLVRWTASGSPRFLGDALADPVTGLAAAIGGLRAMEQGGGVLVDVALARSAAAAAAVLTECRAEP